MRIAVIGAPTSGKSDLAKSMARLLNRAESPIQKGCMSYDHNPWRVIDNYVPKLEARTGTKFGPGAGYVENVQIMSQRWLLEDEAAHSGYNTITCGSVYDTFTYAAMLNIDPPADEQALLFQRQLVSVMMNFFALMAPVGRYDHVFFLPWENREHEHNWHAVVNAKIPEILTACGVTATALTGTKRQKTTDALKITRLVQEVRDQAEATIMADESGV